MAGDGRDAERRAGAAAAEDALRRGGAAVARVLGHEPDGRPAWPAGWTGSISHGGGVAVSVVRRTDLPSGQGLGVDVEVSGGLPLDDARVVLTPRELAGVGSGALPEPTVVWAAKEAAFKAWSHAAAGLGDVDPLDISIELEPDVVLGRWRLEASTAGSLRHALVSDDVDPMARGRIHVDGLVVVLAGVGFVST